MKPSLTVEAMAEVVQLLEQIHLSEKRLRELLVVRSHRFPSDLGEWYGSVLFGLNLAENLSQKGFDLICPNTTARYQVKTDRKSSVSVWIPESLLSEKPAPFDELIILGLSERYKIRECFKVPISQIRLCSSKKRRDRKINLTSSRLRKNGFEIVSSSLIKTHSTPEVVRLLFE